MVDWSFLDYMLDHMGFGVKWHKWIQSCVSSAHFSVLVSGSPKDFFFRALEVCAKVILCLPCYLLLLWKLCMLCCLKLLKGIFFIVFMLSILQRK